MKDKYLGILIIGLIILIIFISFSYQSTKKLGIDNNKSLNNKDFKKDTANNNEFIMFRTYKLDYSTGNAVAFSRSCEGSRLKQYGRTHETCFSHMCNETPEFFIPTGDSKIKFWGDDTGYVCICDLSPQSDIESGYARIYLITDNDAKKADSSAITINPEYEVKCSI